MLAVSVYLFWITVFSFISMEDRRWLQLARYLGCHLLIQGSAVNEEGEYDGRTPKCQTDQVN